MEYDCLGPLFQWFLSHCNGQWEHNNGFSIATFDNPGFSIKISCQDSDLNPEFDWGNFGFDEDGGEKDDNDVEFFVIEKKDYGVSLFSTPGKMNEAMSALMAALL
ncbi:Immunity protein 53 [Rubritalea squalenifaciens DSM 18772]|uniref:Immunity protein 53 n=1 Tax=Rubritalea squalenifaciens DSM 18772 TaxID=1123071 RepID=A0A1M6CVA6_9BACT|nr:Imm53 family immunity protein [Rubritalea squalenifaciens]SHI64916.1 Immunity protein 53 [Rubritalea squalenifaciens DSM 18772]